MHYREGVLSGWIRFFHYLYHASLKLGARQHDQASATLTTDFDISAHAGHFPVKAAAGMLFFHAYYVTQIKTLALHGVPLPILWSNSYQLPGL
jgi:hypothetical protein